MRCPFCGLGEDKVLESRTLKEGREIRRRRECEGCNRRFTTYERVEEPLPMVVKVDGRREPFDRHKIEAGLVRASTKRPVSTRDLHLLVDDVEREIGELGLSEVSSKDLGERILPKLRLLDEVAYVRFASIYRNFKDIEEFLKELGEVRRNRDIDVDDENGHTTSNLVS